MNSREEFEKWAEGESSGPHAARVVYGDYTKQLRWEGWQGRQKEVDDLKTTNEKLFDMNMKIKAELERLQKENVSLQIALRETK